MGYAPRAAMRDDLHLLARLYHPGRGRYEVEFEVVEHFFHSIPEALVHLAVSGVRHRKARRASPRVAVSTPATARIKYCRSLPRDTELEVRLVDISATGCAFVTQKELATGDLVRVQAVLSGRAIDLEARVVRIDPAPYERYRAGCEITEISRPVRTTDLRAGRAERRERFGGSAQPGGGGGPRREPRRQHGAVGPAGAGHRSRTNSFTNSGDSGTLRRQVDN